MSRVLTDRELLHELEDVAEDNVNRHLAMAKDWHPHDYVPWDDGRNFAALGGEDWDPEQSRLMVLRSWVLDQGITEIEMTERQFWNFAQLQPIAEKPWVSFMGRPLLVPSMPEGAQRHLGIYDTRQPGVI